MIPFYIALICLIPHLVHFLCQNTIAIRPCDTYTDIPSQTIICAAKVCDAKVCDAIVCDAIVCDERMLYNLVPKIAQHFCVNLIRDVMSCWNYRSNS